MKWRLRSRVIVQLKTGESFAGVLMESDRQALVLRQAEHLGGPQGAQPFDGELVVLLGDVRFLQVL